MIWRCIAAAVVASFIAASASAAPKTPANGVYDVITTCQFTVT